MDLKCFAVKQIFRINYKKDNIYQELVSWEERIIIVIAENFDEAYVLAEKFGLEYEAEYENTTGEIVEIKLAYLPNCYLSELVGIESGTEVYSSGFFDATEEDIIRMLEIMSNE